MVTAQVAPLVLQAIAISSPVTAATSDAGGGLVALLHTVEQALPLVLTIIGSILTWYVKTVRDAKVAELDTVRLQQVAELAVRAAEELGQREGWPTQEKLTYVRNVVVTAFPALPAETVDMAIHGVLTMAGLGVTGNRI